MDLENIIYKRKSCRHFLDESLDKDTLNEISDFILNCKSLFDIETRFKIVDKSSVKSILRWTAPHYLAIFSKVSDNYLVNVGFIYQQVDLYLQSKGLGSCWIGLGNYTGEEIPGFEFVIFIAFGKPEGEVYRNIDDFKRKSLDDISDYPDEALLPALYAPSAANGQPWYFKHNGEYFDVYQIQPGVLKKRLFSIKNITIDIGIALAHLYVANPDSFKFFINTDFENIKKHKYMGSFLI